MTGKKNPEISAPGSGSASNPHDTEPPLKWKRVLNALVAGQSFNRFEAERELADHCLHSTVSTLQSKGVRILRRTERVPGYMGIPTECRRYWIDPQSRQRASELLKPSGLIQKAENTLASAGAAP